MRNLKIMDNIVTSMTSLEIAELSGKEHKNILRDIRVILEQLKSSEDGSELSSGFKSSTYLAGNGKQEVCFELDNDATICLVTGYDPVPRMRIIKRWKFLEEQNLKIKEDETKRITERNEARVGYYPMLDALVEARAIEGKDTELTHFMKEANLLNRIVLGKTSRQYRLENKIPTLRDYLPKNKISAINDLQLANMVLINLNFNYEDRKTLLDKRFKEKWINLVEEDILILLE